MRSQHHAFPLLAALLLSATQLAAEDAPTLKKLLENVASADAAVRLAARSQAAAIGAPAVEPLAKMLLQPPEPVKDEALRLDIATTARACIDRIVHTAGRPGADAARKDVAAALANLLGSGNAVRLKREVLHWIGFCGDDGSVTAVARCLDESDKHVAEAARLTLERLPGKAALQALEQAAKRLPDDRKADILYSIGKKGDASAVPFLVEAASKSKGKARLGALEALARLGAPEALAAFDAALAEQDLPERLQVHNERLRLADNLVAANAIEPALKIYRDTLVNAPADAQRERALFQLTSEGRPAVLEAALTGLADSADSVRNVALVRLAAMQNPEVFAALRKAYADAKANARPTILRAMHDRDASAAAPLVQEAASSQNVELKITALDLLAKLDDPTMESDYLKVAESGAAGVRPIAVRGYLLIAQKRLSANEKDAAIAMFTRALEIATRDEDRADALKGIISAGDPKAIGTLDALLKDPLLGTEAARGYVAFAGKIGAAGDKDAAEARLKKILTGDFPRDVRSEAAEGLRSLGRDPQASLVSAGFVVAWWLIGPMDNKDGKGLETKYFPEDVIDLVHEQRIDARRFRWQEYRDITLDGVINLVPVFRRSDDRVAYAYTELDSPTAQDAVIRLGSDDGIACWLNGKQVHLKNASRPLKVDDDEVKVRLEPGRNKVLLKISNVGGTWAFVCRTTDSGGKPLALAAGVKP